MSRELYLVAHKVRGEPAFDIAERIEIGDEEGWIIPTSGHRAYPILHWPLSELCQYVPEHDWQPSVLTITGPLVEHPEWASLEDHYPLTRAADAPKPSAAGLLAQLGLAKPKPIVPRRV